MRRLVQALLLWTVSVSAWAEPATITAIFAFVAYYAVAIQIALVVAMNVYSSASARRKMRRAESEARAAFNSQLEDRNVTFLQADPPLRIVYGEAMTGGDVVATFTTDSTRTRDDGTSYTKPDALKHLVIVMAAHEVQAIGEVCIMGLPLGALDGNGWVTGGEFYANNMVHSREVLIAPAGVHVAPAAATVFSAWDTVQSSGTPEQGINMVAGSYTLTVGNTTITNTGSNSISVTYTYTLGIARVRVDRFLGTDAQTTNAYLNSVAPAQWTANHRLRGLAGIVLTLDLEDARFHGGPPQISAMVKGKLILDPRTSTTAWSDNNALCIRDYLTSWLGLSVPAAYVDVPLCNAAANACDVGVNVVDFSRANNWFRFNTEADLEGWSVAGATLAVTGGNAAVTSNSTDPEFIRNNLTPTVVGTTHRAVRARIKRVAGAAWQGDCFFDNTAHGFSASFYKHIAEPTYDPVTGWAEVLWDMTTLTVGGADWTTSTIRHIRLDLGAGASDVFLVDWVTVGPLTSPTYTLNGTLTTGDGKEAALELMAESMMGSVSYGATWAINAGAWTAPVMDLLDDDLDGQISFPQTDSSLEEVFNGVRGVFLPYASQAPIEFDSYQNPSYVTDDGGALWHDFRLPFCNSGARATNLCRIKTETERVGQVLQLPAKLKAFPLQIGDRVRVSSAEYGLVLKTYRVTDWQFSIVGAVVLTLQRDVATSYDLINATSSTAAPNTALPNPWRIAAPVVNTPQSGTAHLLRQADGTILTRVKVTWNATLDAYIMAGQGKVRVRYHRQWIDASGVWWSMDVPGDQLGVYLAGMADGEWLSIGVKFVNSFGAESGETFIQHAVVGKTEAPSNVAGLAATIVQGGVRIGWSEPPDLDYDSTELRYGASWAAGVFLFRGNASSWTWLSPAQGTYTVRAKHYDTSGNASTADQTTSAVVDAAALLLWTSITGAGKPADNATVGAPAGTYVGGTLAQTVEANAVNALANAATAQTAANTANTALTNIASDLILSPSEKPPVVLEYTTITAEQAGIDAQATAYSITTEKTTYDTAVTALTTYLGTLTGWNTIPGSDVVIVGTTFRAKFADVYAARQALLNKISAIAITLTNVLWVNGANMTITGNSVKKTSGTGGYDASVYSKTGYTGGAYVSWSVPATNTDFLIGLNTDPTTDNDYASLDYAILLALGGTWLIYESGVSTGVTGSYASSDMFAVTYDGQFVRYSKNGAVLRTVAALPGLKFFADSSFSTLNGVANNLAFGPFGNAFQTRGANLVDSSWWKPGVNPLARWASSQSGAGGADDFVSALGPDGSSQIVWRATQSTGVLAGGGWNPNTDPSNSFNVDPNKTYLFACYLKRTNGTDGSVYWGVDGNTTADLNTTTANTNPYFAVAVLPLGVWCLAIGTIYPQGSSGHAAPGRAGFYRCDTGELLAAGTNYNWLSSAIATCSTRALQYYAAAGTIEYIVSPQVYLCDGSEPNIDDLLSMMVPTGRIAPNAATEVAVSTAQSPAVTGTYNASYGGQIGILQEISWYNATAQTVYVEATIDNGGIKTAGTGGAYIINSASTSAFSAGGTNNGDLFLSTQDVTTVFKRRTTVKGFNVAPGATAYAQALGITTPQSGSPVTLTGSDVTVRLAMVKR